jgi:hypothetical protein
MQVGYHAIALDAKGHSIPDKIWGWEMPVLADFNPRAFNPTTVRHDGEPVDALADAREWAAKIFESDSRVASVWIRESIQDIDFVSSWREGKGVDTIRPEVPSAPTCASGRHIWPTYQVGRCECGAISTD